MGFDHYTGFQTCEEDQRTCSRCGGDYTARPADETPLCDGCVDAPEDDDDADL